VKVDNPIIVPGSDRLTFGVGQNEESEVFYVPAGPVGPAHISFNSRSLRDYSGPHCGELEFEVDVLGTITSNLGAQTLGDGVYTNVAVTIHPPALGTVEVFVDASAIGVAVPSTLVFKNGEDTAYYRLLPKFDDVVFPVAINYTAQYYDDHVDYIYVIGTIFTSVPPTIPTTGIEDLHVAILPGAVSTPVTVYLTPTNNVIVPQFITFPPGVSLVHFSLQAIAEGPGSITFSSAGYVSFTDNFIVQDLVCSAVQTFNENSAQCVACPVVNGTVCSGNGDCSFSTIDQYKARCECDDGYVGGYCEIETPSQFPNQFTANGATFVYTNIPGVTKTTVVVAPETIVDNNPVDGGNGTIYLRGYTSTSAFPLAVNPTANPPTITNYRTVTLSPGFGIDVTYSDNTIFDLLDNPLDVTFAFDKLAISQTDFLEMSLYYYNLTQNAWVPAINICPGDQLYDASLTDLTIETYLCVLGQYQFFAFIPIPQLPTYNQEKLVYTYNDYKFGHQDTYQFPTTGNTGIQQALPPQPHLAVIANDPSPPRNLAEPPEKNASSFVEPSFFLVVILVLSLIF